MENIDFLLIHSLIITRDKHTTIIPNESIAIHNKRTLHVELRQSGITTKIIYSGPIQIERFPNTHQKIANENCVNLADWNASLLMTTPVNRFGELEDLASRVDFLSLDEAGFINGQTINLDNGRVLN